MDEDCDSATYPTTIKSTNAHRSTNSRTRSPRNYGSLRTGYLQLQDNDGRSLHSSSRSGGRENCRADMDVNGHNSRSPSNRSEGQEFNLEPKPRNYSQPTSSNTNTSPNSAATTIPKPPICPTWKTVVATISSTRTYKSPEHDVHDTRKKRCRSRSPRSRSTRTTSPDHKMRIKQSRSRSRSTKPGTRSTRTKSPDNNKQYRRRTRSPADNKRRSRSKSTRLRSPNVAARIKYKTMQNPDRNGLTGTKVGRSRSRDSIERFGKSRSGRRNLTSRRQNQRNGEFKKSRSRTKSKSPVNVTARSRTRSRSKRRSSGSRSNRRSRSRSPLLRPDRSKSKSLKNSKETSPNDSTSRNQKPSQNFHLPYRNGNFRRSSQASINHIQNNNRSHGYERRDRAEQTHSNCVSYVATHVIGEEAEDDEDLRAHLNRKRGVGIRGSSIDLVALGQAADDSNTFISNSIDKPFYNSEFENWEEEEEKPGTGAVVESVPLLASVPGTVGNFSFTVNNDLIVDTNKKKDDQVILLDHINKTITFPLGKEFDSWESAVKELEGQGNKMFLHKDVPEETQAHAQTAFPVGVTLTSRSKRSPIDIISAATTIGTKRPLSKSPTASPNEIPIQFLPTFGFPLGNDIGSSSGSVSTSRSRSRSSSPTTTISQKVTPEFLHSIPPEVRQMYLEYNNFKHRQGGRSPTHPELFSNNYMDRRVPVGPDPEKEEFKWFGRRRSSVDDSFCQLGSGPSSTTNGDIKIPGFGYKPYQISQSHKTNVVPEGPKLTSTITRGWGIESDSPVPYQYSTFPYAPSSRSSLSSSTLFSFGAGRPTSIPSPIPMPVAQIPGAGSRVSVDRPPAVAENAQSIIFDYGA